LSNLFISLFHFLVLLTMNLLNLIDSLGGLFLTNNRLSFSTLDVSDHLVMGLSLLLILSSLFFQLEVQELHFLLVDSLILLPFLLRDLELFLCHLEFLLKLLNLLILVISVILRELLQVIYFFTVLLLESIILFDEIIIDILGLLKLFSQRCFCVFEFLKFLVIFLLKILVFRLPLKD